MDSLYTETNLIDIILFIIYFILIVQKSRSYININKKIGILAFLIGVEHLFFSVFSYYYIISNPADAKLYFLSASTINDWGIHYLQDGTTAVIFFAYILVKFLKISFLGCCFIFSFISYMGIMLIYKICINLLKNRFSIWLYLFLLFGVHFWISALGKDALIFYGMSLLLYNYYYRKNIFKYILPVLIIGIIRLHILLFIIVGTAISIFLFSKKIKKSFKLVLILLIGFALFIIVPPFLEKLHIDSFESFNEGKDVVIKGNMEGAGAIDIENSFFIYKWISYLFRPFIFEARNFLFLIAGLENLIWLLLFYKIGLKIYKRKFYHEKSDLMWFSLISILIITFPLALILSNLGIALRQKIMVVPFLYVLFFILLKSKHKSNLQNSK